MKRIERVFLALLICALCVKVAFAGYTNFSNLNVKGALYASGEQVVYDSGVLANATSAVTISGLNGDTDQEYRLVSYIVSNQATNINPWIRLNNNSTANIYGVQRLWGNSTTITAMRTTYNALYLNGNNGLLNGYISFSDTLIHAKSGYLRTALNKSTYAINGTTVDTVEIGGWSWNNTADNLTSIVVGGGTDLLGVGSRFILFARRPAGTEATSGTYFANVNVKGNLTAGVWQRVYGTTLTGATASIDVTGLTGNTDVLYNLKLYSINDGAGTNEIRVRLNADGTAAHYGYQTLYGTSTTAGASRSTYGNIYGGYGTGDGHLSMAEILIYAPSGYVRPALVETITEVSATTITAVENWGQSWNNTADEITSIHTDIDNTGLKAGSRYELWALRLKQ